jgi:hypothetical protein
MVTWVNRALQFVVGGIAVGIGAMTVYAAAIVMTG